MPEKSRDGPFLRGGRGRALNKNPRDALGTIRQGPGLIAVRAYSINTDRHIGWYIFDLDSGLTPGQVKQLDLNDWPIVYQPPNISNR